MTELVIFKKHLKEKQSVLKKNIKALEQELQGYRELKRDKTKSDIIKVLKASQKSPIIMGLLNLDIEFLMSVKNSFAEVLEEIDVEALAQTHIDLLSLIYNSHQALINAMDNDKIINFVDLELLIKVLLESILSYEISSKVLGMAVSFDNKYLAKNKKTNTEISEIIKQLANYYKSDGSFCYNEDIEQFMFLLNALFNKYRISNIALEEYEKLKKRINIFVKGITSLLEKSNNKTKDEDNEIGQINNEVKREISREYQDSREKLKRYYKNGKLIEVPEDIEAFSTLLDKCDLGDADKRYILNLVNEKLRKLQENRVLKYLNSSEQDIYFQAKKLLDSLKPYEDDYYVIIQILRDLNAAGDSLEEATNDEEKDYLMEEISSQMDSLREILIKHNIDDVSDNTLLFLCDENKVPYLKIDSDELDGSFYKMICSGIKKVRKDNQGSFKPIITNKKLSYRIYDLVISRVHISFIEIDQGIYLLVGVKNVGQDYDTIVNRVLGYEKEIHKLEEKIKDERLRNSILKRNELYLELFNPEEKLNQTRKKEQ